MIKKKDLGSMIPALIGLLIIVFILSSIVFEWRQCEKMEGHYVRVLFGFDCIGGKR